VTEAPLNDPLITRSLPDGLWRFVPQNWTEWDIQIQAWAQKSVDLNHAPWKQLQWLSERPQGIALLYMILILGFLFLNLKSKNPLTSLRRYLFEQLRPMFKRIAVVLVVLGLSDLTSSYIKMLVGRLKPHVTFYNPSVYPALSFPSNHAFNSAVLFSFLFFSISPLQRTHWKWAYTFLAFALFLIGISRVFFGQHYPLDVISGWILGFVFGKIAQKITQVRVLQNFINPTASTSSTSSSSY